MTGEIEKIITVVGAGIAGLTVALCLNKRSIPVKIIEKHPQITTAGAGIQITPNAFRVLEELGLGDLVKTSGHKVGHLSILKGPSGAPITQMPLGADFECHHNAPYLVLKRQALLDILYKASRAQNIEIEFNKPYTPDNKSNDEIIIGADGVWSSLREQVNSVKAHYSGRTAFRCMLPADKAPKWAKSHDLAMWLGDNAHFVTYPIDEAGTLNLVCVVKDAQPKKHWSSPATLNDIMRHLKGWNEKTLSLVRTSENWQRWPLYTVLPDQAWSHENKVLIGDAAHAMVPFLAQGGAMAIEDAATLAHTIANTPDKNTAFATYQLSRQKRVNRVWNEAKANGERYHWSGMMAQARNLGLKAMGGERLQQRYNWIYNWQPPSL